MFDRLDRTSSTETKKELKITGWVGYLACPSLEKCAGVLGRVENGVLTGAGLVS